MAYVFALTNAKGGCGKTTVALNLVICFAKEGFRTLAIDLDQQGNLSAGLGVDLNQLKLTAHRLLVSDAAETESYWVDVRPRLKLLPKQYRPLRGILTPALESKMFELPALP